MVLRSNVKEEDEQGLLRLYTREFSTFLPRFFFNNRISIIFIMPPGVRILSEQLAVHRLPRPVIVPLPPNFLEPPQCPRSVVQQTVHNK